MILINSQFLKVVHDQVQEKIDTKIKIFKTLNPTTKLIKLNSGDVVRPLAPCVVDAMTKCVAEMGNENTFKGRAPEQGYDFLIDAIVKNDFRNRKIKIGHDEIFINDGTKEDLAGVGDILCKDNRIAVIDPVFQTYIESNVIGNRAGEMNEKQQWSHIIYLECKKENEFMPALPKVRPDVIYLSYPNDPTGCVMNKETLEKWVKYALKNNTLILFDATYESFITDKSTPHSIYEIRGAKKCAIEFRSFSKSAGFTGLHCGYTVIPKDLEGYSFTVDTSVGLNTLWLRRQQIKNYSPAYVIQRGAESLYTEEGVE
ncbi:MAG: aminotransferase class I/II-fold pyridoxal phosphate-dependent enzyme, partial [Rikenellaceae bacterium]